MSNHHQNNKPQNMNQRPPMMGRGPGGPGGRMMGFKEKPKNAKDTLKRVLSYIAKNKTLFFVTLAIVLINTVLLLYCNVLVKDVISSFGEMDENFNFTKNPDNSLLEPIVITCSLL